MSDETLKSRIQEDMKTAMRQKDKARLSVIRLIMAAVKQREVDERITLTDADVLQVLDKMVKQRRDAASQFESAGRDDLVRQEQFEVTVLQTYLPAALSEAEVLVLIKATMTKLGVTSAKDMGKLMQALKPELQGRADMKWVSQQVKDQLQ